MFQVLSVRNCHLVGLRKRVISLEVQLAPTLLAFENLEEGQKSN